MNIPGKSVSEIVKDKEVEQVLRFAESDKLSGFVLQYASSHSDFKSALLETFLPKKPVAKLSVDYQMEIEKCFNSAYKMVPSEDGIMSLRLTGMRYPVK